ncbi:hypothetical protein SAMN04489708_11460 [Paracidovorax cattleyae]|uniref:Uncharacterized protein n=1 Tax=Paracidovorax cattleyae TaxID=80868 RepID=A0A1H0T8Q8_9BURK|nr:hypothetical protein SAMN04489708_11460 [Paracidovorax cattleyae]
MRRCPRRWRGEQDLPGTAHPGGGLQHLSHVVVASGRDELAQMLQALEDTREHPAHDRGQRAPQRGSRGHGQRGNLPGQPGSERPHRKPGERAGAHRRLHGTTGIDRATERRQRAPGEPTGQERGRRRDAGRAGGQPGSGDDARHQRVVTADLRHHPGNREHRLADQHPGAERRRGSRACRRAGARIRGGGQRGACDRRQRSGGAGIGSGPGGRGGHADGPGNAAERRTRRGNGCGGRQPEEAGRGSRAGRGDVQPGRRPRLPHCSGFSCPAVALTA